MSNWDGYVPQVRDMFRRGMEIKDIATHLKIPYCSAVKIMDLVIIAEKQEYVRFRPAPRFLERDIPANCSFEAREVFSRSERDYGVAGFVPAAYGDLSLTEKMIYDESRG